MRRLIRIIPIVAILLASACGLHIPPAPTPPVTPPVVTPPATGIAVLTVAVTPPSAVVQVGERKWSTRPDGTIVEEFAAGTYAVTVTAPGYVPKHFDVTLQAGDRTRQDVTLERLSAPWETVTVDQLRAWRGSISTVLAPMPCGPRPKAADNVLFTAMIDTSCWSADDRQRAYAAYRAAGYTHWAMGPLSQNGYHGQYPNSDFRVNPDDYFDRIEEVWRAGFTPAIALLPDNGACSTGSSVDWDCVRRELDPVYKHPRFQAMARIVFQAWEPSDWTPDIWRAVNEWMAEILPNALRFNHFESNYWAPCKGRDFVGEGGRFVTGGDCWRYARSELLHGVLIQETWSWGEEDGYLDIGGIRTGEQQVMYDLWDYGRRIIDGFDEPTPIPSAWGPGIALDMIAFEYASYYVTRQPSNAPASIRMGRLLMDPLAAFRDPVTGHWVDPSKYLKGFGDGGPGIVRR